MSATATKKAPGVTSKRTVSQLTRVSFQIRLIYDRDGEFGSDNYELVRGTHPSAGNKPLKAGEVLGNVVKTPSSGHPDNERAALPTGRPADSSGGDVGGNTNPVVDEVVRIVIDDPHTLPQDEMGEAFAEDYSRVEWYRTGVFALNDPWIAHIRPMIPLRIEVSKHVGGKRVDLKEPLKVVLELKDPPEELGMHEDGSRAQEFMRDFFRRHRAKPGDGAAVDADEQDRHAGDDNAPAAFDGVRSPDVGGALRADDVFRLVEPEPDRLLLVKPKALGPRRVELDVVPEADPSAAQGAGGPPPVKVGSARVWFRPWPAGGDNHRFLLTLTDASGQDVREQRINGGSVILRDDDGRRILPPYAYTTGRFVIWKRIRAELVARVNHETLAAGGWDDVQRRFTPAFYEIEPPDAARVVEVTYAQWRAALIRVFGDVSQVRPEHYAFGLVPLPLMGEAARLKAAKVDVVKDLTRLLIESTCDQILGVDDPRSGTHSRGLYVMVCKGPAYPFKRAFGEYVGDGTVWISTGNTQRQPPTRELHRMVAHETGHALWLRHAHTTFTPARWLRAGQSDVLKGQFMLLYDGGSDTFLTHHDQHGAYNCLMAYSHDEDTRPCAVCALSLRFYDRPKIINSDPDRHQILEGLKQAQIVSVTEELIRGRVFHALREDVLPLPVGHAVELMAVSRPQELPTKPFQARVNLSCVGDAPLSMWTVSHSNLVRIQTVDKVATNRPNRIQVVGSQPGRTTIKFTFKDDPSITTSVEIEVFELSPT